VSIVGQARRCIALGVMLNTWPWQDLPFGCEALREFFVDMQADGFPAVHYSDTSARTYHPAYRIVVRRFLVGLSAPHDNHRLLVA
jgi:hypothetical protein